MSNGENSSDVREKYHAFRLPELLAKLYVLRYPDLAQPWSKGKDDNDEPCYYPTVEQVMVDPRVSPRDKSLDIKSCFVRIAESVNGRTGGASFYQKLVSYCYVNIVPENFEDFVSYENDILTVEQILPPKRVVEAMNQDWMQDGRQFCATLETYIAGHTENLPPIRPNPGLTEERLRNMGLVILNDHRYR